MFKKIISTILFITVLKIGFAQTIDTTLIFLRFPTVPPFKITNVADSTSFTKENLKKKK